ncbi:hypothetical protein EON66_11905 [archaeon]|nr:MAG: hypothetical protein EON66_11905 [archaeon]
MHTFVCSLATMLYVWALALVVVAALPSVAFLVGVGVAMRSTVRARTSGGRRPVKGRLTMHIWNEMDAALMYDEMEGIPTKRIPSIYNREGMRYARGDVVIDAGANIGMFSLFAAKWTHGDISLHCFEPMPAMFDLLQKNMQSLQAGELNEWMGIASAPRVSVRCNQVGVFDKREDVEFLFRPNCPISTTMNTGDLAERQERAEVELTRAFQKGAIAWLLPTPLVQWGAKKIVRHMTLAGEQRVKARVIPLSDYIDEHNLQHIDMLKIDVESAEEPALRGIREEHGPRIAQVMVEAEDFAIRDRIMAYLTARGFVCTAAAVRDEILPDCGAELTIVYAKRK